MKEFNYRFGFQKIVIQLSINVKRKLKKGGIVKNLLSLLPNPCRIHRSCVEEQVLLMCTPLVSSRISHALDKRLIMHHLKCIFQDRIQKLYLSSILQPVLPSIHLDQEQCKFRHIEHSQYIFVHQHLEVLQQAIY